MFVHLVHLDLVQNIELGRQKICFLVASAGALFSVEK